MGCRAYRGPLRSALAISALLSKRMAYRVSSFASASKNSAKARFPANSAAVRDWYPLSRILTPMGLLRRLSS
jgi:hypothetical protein